MKSPIRKIVIGTLAAGLLAGLSVVTPTPGASAADSSTTRVGTAITASALAAMAVDPENSFVSTIAKRDAVEASTANLEVVRMSAVIEGGHKTRSICHPTDLHVTAAVDGYCWNTADDTTANWFPQGMTGSGDGKNGTVLYEPCDGCAGREITAVSWRSGDGYTPWGKDGLQRITFTDVTDGMADAFYRHVLLVEPDGSTSQYRSIKNHADGLVWYGNKLFVFTGGIPGTPGGDQVIRVFDLTHIWKMSSTSSNAVGCTSTICSAANSLFALPQIGQYRFPGGGVCTPLTGNKVCFTSASLDRSTAPDSIVTTEYSESGTGRIVRWPLDASTALLKTSADGKVHPSEGWYSPITHLQGGVVTGNNGLLTGLCPDGAPAVSYMPGGTAAEYAEYDKYCFWKFGIAANRASITAKYWTTVPANSQNVSYWPGSQELWVVNEYRGSYDGSFGSDRLVLNLKCADLVCT